MRKHVFAYLAVLLMLSGCTNSENIDMENNAHALTEEQMTELFEQYDRGETQWKPPVFAEDYAPAENEENGLYRKLPLDKTVPHEKIEVRAFGEGKVVYSYLTERFGVNGGEVYDSGQAVIYDLVSENFVSGDHFPRDGFWSGEVAFAGDSYYMINSVSENAEQYALIEFNLNNGAITPLETFPEDLWLGHFVKLDKNRFAIAIDGWDQVLLFHAEKEQDELFFAKNNVESVKISGWNGELYCFWMDKRTVLLESGRFIKTPFESTLTVPCVTRKNLDTAEETDYEVIQTIHVHPGTDVRALIEGKDYSFHSSYFANGWYIFEDNTVRAIRLTNDFCGTDDRTGMAQNIGISYHWDAAENVLYSLDIHTGMMQFLDFGHRNKKIWFFSDENGNVLIAVEDGRDADTKLAGVYYIPVSTVLSKSVPYSTGN